MSKMKVYGAKLDPEEIEPLLEGRSFGSFFRSLLNDNKRLTGVCTQCAGRDEQLRRLMAKHKELKEENGRLRVENKELVELLSR